MFKAFVIFLSFFSFSSFSSTLTIPENFQLLKVNGKEYSSSLFAKEVQLELTSGKHVLLLRYKEMFEDDDNDDHTTIKSPPFLLMFDIYNEPLQIKSVHFIDDSTARAYAKKPTVVLENTKKVKVASKSLLLSEFEQNQYRAALTKVQNEQVELMSTSTLESKQSIQQPANLKQNSRASEMLNYWWQQATAHEQQQFIKQHVLKKGE